MYEPFQEINKDIASNLTLDQHESHGTPWRDGRDHVAAETGSGRGNDRCSAMNCPRLARVEIGSHPCLVTKENICLLPLRQSTNLRIFLFDPYRNTFSIFLKSTPEWLLRAEAKLIHQSTYRCFAEMNVELTSDQFSYHETRPQRKGKLQLSWVFHRHSIINPFHHLGCQLGWATTTLASIQGVPSPSAIKSKPAEQGRPLHSKHLRHQCCRLSVLDCGYSSFPQFREFTMCKPSSIIISHTPTISY